MSTNLMIQSPKDQFLHWRQDMERKQEEQARYLKELQAHAERLQRENDQLWAQIERSRDLGKEVRDSGRAVQLIARYKGKKPIIPNDVDTLADDELSSSSSLYPSLSLTRMLGRARRRLRKRPLSLPTFSNAISGASRRTRKEARRRQNRLDQALRNPSMLPSGTMPPLPLVHPAFGTWPTFYMPATTLIHRLDDMLSSPLGQHILDYEPPHGFVKPTFATFDGSFNPYDHMLHYNQAMILNVSNDRLLCKVFPSSLRGPALAWFHKLPRNSINSFNELWGHLYRSIVF